MPKLVIKVTRFRQTFKRMDHNYSKAKRIKKSKKYIKQKIKYKKMLNIKMKPYDSKFLSILK